VLLHGGGGTGTGVSRQGDWDRVAAREGFVTLAPDGTSRAWNAGSCCGPPERDGVDDEGFVLAAIGRVTAEHDIDPARVYATGLSNGGMMAYRLACRAPEVFAAIAPVGCSSVWAPGPRASVSLLHIHGLRDEFVPFEGGHPHRSLQLHPPSYRPVVDVVAEFVAVNGCPPEATVRTAGEGERAVVTTTWAPGPFGAAVELVTIPEGMHSWPGGRRMLRALDPPSLALDATAAIWRFFAAHPAPPSSPVHLPI
jgi:polyhydroxybutyrate depolymerase